MSAFDELKGRLTVNLDKFETRSNQVSDSVPLSKAWIDAEAGSADENPAAPLLKGARLMLLEAATAWALGLNRGAAGSLRTYIENLFAWLYFKDHPVEYALVEQKTRELILPKSTQAYLKDIDKGFEKAYKYLNKNMDRPSEYFYTDLSFFVHAHPNQILKGKTASELVVTVPPEAIFTEICSQADEFISDNFVVAYRHSWGSVPAIVKDNVSARLGKKAADFLAVA